MRSVLLSIYLFVQSLLAFGKNKLLCFVLVSKAYKCGDNLNVYGPLYLTNKYCKLTLGDGVSIGRRVLIDVEGSITIGNGVSLLDDVEITGFGNLTICDNATINRSVTIKVGGIVIGKSTWVGQHSIIEGNVVVGDNCIFGPYTHVASGRHRTDSDGCTYMNSDSNPGTISLGVNCFIGSGSRITGNSNIGDFVSVAANSHVNSNFQNKVIIGGGVAKIVKCK
jgi:acetyltransferase-like isoleucine patch superfamily enzyme